MITVLALLASLALLCCGAELTIRGARSFGLRVGLSPVVVGLTIVAYGTSLPELVVSTDATLEGHDGIALANVVGSNICNVLLILGLCALIRPMAVHARILRVEAPILVCVTVLVSGLLLRDDLGRASGLVLLIALAVYTVWTVRGAPKELEDVIQDIGKAQPPPASSVWTDVALAGAGLVLLIAGGILFVRGASEGALALGIPPTWSGSPSSRSARACPS